MIPVTENKRLALILFLLEHEQGYLVRQCALEDAEQKVRYWLEKSPGIHKNEMEHIYVIPMDQIQDFAWLVRKMEEEAFAFQEKMREAHEQREYERLKQKFEGRPQGFT
jgi:hypothetical protein